MQVELRCTRILTFMKRDATGLALIGDLERKPCDGLLALKERIISNGEAFFWYECTRCGARKLIKGWAEEAAEDNHKVPSVEEQEEKYLEANR